MHDSPASLHFDADALPPLTLDAVTLDAAALAAVEPGAPPGPTIYERLGGEVAIDAAVDRLFDRLLADPELAAFFDNTPMERHRAYARTFIAMALGGPQVYRGRAMGEAHARIGLTDRHFDLTAAHLASVLAGLGVGLDLADEVVGVVATLRPMVVTA